MTSSRLIRAGDAQAGCKPWQAPEVSGHGQLRRADNGELTALQQRAWNEGFEQGRVAGVEAGQRELTARVAAVEHVLDTLARPLEDLDHRVETEVLALVQALVRQLIRREIRQDPEHIIGIIREGLAALPLSAEDVTVRLHPDDAEVVRHSLKPDDRERAWSVESDPLMERGGCLITSARSNIDGRLDTRLARVIAGLLGDERDGTG